MGENNRSIGYQECTDAMLMMWMEYIITDKEYNNIMDRLNRNYNKECNYDRKTVY